jgi:hypothetical protein
MALFCWFANKSIFEDVTPLERKAVTLFPIDQNKDQIMQIMPTVPSFEKRKLTD